MPWYQPGVSRGYSRFYDVSGDPDREDRWIVSDAYLFMLEDAYRRAYVNAGGPDYDDTSANTFDYLAANNVSTAEQAAQLGAQNGRADKAAGVQEFHVPSIAPGLAPYDPSIAATLEAQAQMQRAGLPSVPPSGLALPAPPGASSGPSDPSTAAAALAASGGYAALLNGGYTSLAPSAGSPLAPASTRFLSGSSSSRSMVLLLAAGVALVLFLRRG